MGNGAVEEYLKALMHPVRRMIIRLLAEKGSLTYSELMRLTKVDDSGTFGFHLRGLRGLVRKNEEGEYELTSEGWRVYRALKHLEALGASEEQEAEVQAGGGEVGVSKWEVVVLEDRFRLDVDYDLLSRLRREGKKLLVRDIMTVVIHDVPEELLDGVLEGIEDCVTVYVPKRFRSLVQLRSRDVLTLKEYEGEPPKGEGILGSLVSAIGSAVSSLVSALFSAGFPVFGNKAYIRKEVEADVKDRYRLAVSLKAGALRVETGEGTRLVGEARIRREEDFKWRATASGVEAELQGGSLSIKAPRGVEELDAEVRSGSLVLGLDAGALRDASIALSAGSASVHMKGLGRCVVDLDVNAGSMKSLLEYGAYEGESLMEVKVSSGSATLRLKVPEDVAVDLDLKHSAGAAIAEVEGFRGTSYRDPHYDAAKAKLKLRGEVRAGALRVVVERVRSPG